MQCKSDKNKIVTGRLNMLIVCALLCVAGAVIPSHSRAEIPNQKAGYILIINTFNVDIPWSDQIILPLLNNYTENPETSVFVEHMDILMVEDSVQLAQLSESMFQKYDPNKPKVVILLGSPTLLFLDDIERRWGDVPVILCSEQDFAGPEEYYLKKEAIPPHERIPLSRLAERYNFTHILAKNYIPQTIDLMRYMIPGMNKIIAIGDQRYISKELDLEMKAEIERSYPWLEYQFVSEADTSTDELYAMLNSVDPTTTAALYISWYSKDTSSSNSVLMANSFRVIANAKAPVFALKSANMANSGIIGGYLYSQPEFDNHLQTSLDQIIHGTPARDIPFFVPSEAGPVFSYTALANNGLRPSDCPPGSIILDRPQTFIEEYWPVLAALLLLGLVIFGLIYQRMRITSLKALRSVQEKAIAASAELANIFDNMPVAFIQMKLIRNATGEVVETEIKHINKHYAKTFGVVKEIVGRRTSELFREHFKTFIAFANIFDKDKRSLTFPFYMSATDSYYNAVLTAASLPDHINMFCVDTTDLHRAQQKLDDTNHKLSMAIEMANIVPWKWDLRSHSIVCETNHPGAVTNPNYDAMEERILYSDTDYFGRIHEQDRTRVTLACKLLAEDRVPKVSEEYRIMNEDGSYDWVEAQATVDARDEDGRPISLIGSLHVITARKHMEDELIEAKNRAEESNRLKSAFLANMSHEIRTPLNAIVGFSGILPSVDEPAERDEYINIIENNNNLLLQLIGDILDLSKIESGMMEFTNAPFDLNETMTEIERSSRLRAESKNIEVSFTERLPHCHIESDRNRITQVLTNLINNATKFTDEGSITFGYTLENGMLDFFVTDTGCGIEEDKQKDVFNRFVKLNSFVQGTGLGLSICETIVKKMGGTMSLTSQVGKGSTFRFTIPYTPTEDKPEPQANEREYMRVNKNEITILVAEDNESNFKLFESILKKDYRVLHAWDGKMAVDMFVQHNPHLVLMDINMPVMNGYEATKLIKQINPNVPVMAVTAYAFASDEQQIISHGFDDYVPKPINAKDMKAKINELIHRHLILF